MSYYFKALKEEDLELVLKWRSDPFINRYMYTEVSNDLEQHKKWFSQKVSNNPNVKHWIIEYQNQKIGCIYVELHKNQNWCTWGFYIGDPNSRFLGGMIPPYLYNYLFYKFSETRLDSEKIQIIKAEVFSANTQILKLHLMHNYVIDGIKEKYVTKGDTCFDVHFLHLTKERWEQKSNFFSDKIAHFE